MERRLPSPKGVALISDALATRAARPLPAAGRDRRRPRRGADARGHRLAADRRAVRAAGTARASPVVRLNHAVAVAMAHGPQAGLRCSRDARRRRAPGRPSPAASPSGPTCWSWPATRPRRERIICRPPAPPTACPRSATWKRGLLGCSATAQVSSGVPTRAGATVRPVPAMTTLQKDSGSIALMARIVSSPAPKRAGRF